MIRMGLIFSFIIIVSYTLISHNYFRIAHFHLEEFEEASEMFEKGQTIEGTFTYLIIGIAGRI